MNKRFIVLTLILFAVITATATAEKQDPATPTDLSCAHEHTKTTIYFFDSPAYASISPDTHRVSGPAVVEKECTDCGIILSSETVDNVEEIRPHSMKKGVCVLCGYRETTGTEKHQQEKSTGERTIIAPEDGKVNGLLTMTLSKAELTSLKNDDISTVLVRGKQGSAAITLSVKDALTQVKVNGTDLYMELVEQEDGSFFAGLYLVAASGERTGVEAEGITLRFYQEHKTGNRICVVPANSDILLETQSIWNEHGFWSVPYLEEGTYIILQ